MIDIHSHILPCIDDGPADMTEAVKMAQIAHKEGIRTIIATPHVNNGVYSPSPEEIIAACAQLNTELEQQNIPVTILPGSEVHLTPEILNELDEKNLLTLNQSSFMLVEMPSHFMPGPVIDVIRALRSKQVTPIIAHPERNMMMLTRPGSIDDMLYAGALLQITSDSLIGTFGSEIKKIAADLVKSGRVDFMASDSHASKGRSPRLKKAAKQLRKIAGTEKSEEILFSNPEKLLS